MSRCTDIPLSWLRLERLALGELGSADARGAREHIAACAACAGALASIESDRRRLRALRLPEPARRVRSISALRLTAAAAAIAALLVFFVGRERDPGSEPAIGGIKGSGELHVGLVRERGGAIDTDPMAFLGGDRFKVSVTCRAPGERVFDVAVIQGGETFRPLGESVRIFCGNETLIPGAFRVTGDQPFSVCVAPGAPLDLQAGRVSAPSCTTLPPAER